MGQLLWCACDTQNEDSLGDQVENQSKLHLGRVLSEMKFCIFNLSFIHIADIG